MTSVEYQNPVWPFYFADPFVLRVGREFFAYGTGGPDDAPTERRFQILHSVDLAHWTMVGHALVPPKHLENGSFWAPEVAERDGKFFMYYSGGGPEGESHRLRVAISDFPSGPFVDAGHELIENEPFSIDASPYYNPLDDAWYLFFARDYFDAPAGTGLAVVRLADDMTHIEGPPVPLVRATADWQIFERNRLWYDREWPVWHTVEGPFAVYREGMCVLFYSGGLWKGADYGVGVAVADSPLGPFVEADTSRGPAVLRGTEGKVLGPGHNSVVLGPDDETYFIVYHAWDPDYTARRMFIDPLIWSDGWPICDGPSIAPRELSLGRL
jgi:arabinan endo-1,5-alpha-L-arabinosidase